MFNSTRMHHRLFGFLLGIGLLLGNFGWAAAPVLAASGDRDGGTVYTMTNATGGNAVQIFRRTDDGGLAQAGSVSTEGRGTGAGLGSQGALVLSEDRRWLFAVNAGSDDVSSFAVLPNGLRLVSRIASGGQMPISLTNHGRLLYALNAGGSGNISGFVVKGDGRLEALRGSSRSLSNGGTGATPGPAQIQFSPDGETLVVTEKATNLIDTFVVHDEGRTGEAMTHPSSGPTPFGFDFAPRGTLVVSEAAGGMPGQSSVSSYRVSEHGVLHNLSQAVPDTQTAACWLVVTHDGRYAYTANAGSGTISSYRLSEDGRLTLLDAVAANTGSTSHPIDMAQSSDGRYLYELNSDAHTIGVYRIGAHGNLISTAPPTAVIATAAGLAAR